MKESASKLHVKHEITTGRLVADKINAGILKSKTSISEFSGSYMVQLTPLIKPPMNPKPGLCYYSEQENCIKVFTPDGWKALKLE